MIYWSQNFLARAVVDTELQLVSFVDFLRVKKNDCSKKTIIQLKFILYRLCSSLTVEAFDFLKPDMIFLGEWNLTF